MALSLRERWEENRRRRAAAVAEIPRTMEDIPDPLGTEIALLGEWAARCELWASGEKWQIGDRERPRLLARVDRYRDLQLVAMAEPWVLGERLRERMRGTL